MTAHDDDALALRLARDVTGTDREARGLIDEARAQAEALLAEHEAAHGRITVALLSQRELDGADVARLIEGEY